MSCQAHLACYSASNESEEACILPIYYNHELAPTIKCSKRSERPYYSTQSSHTASSYSKAWNTIDSFSSKLKWINQSNSGKIKRKCGVTMD